MFGTVTFGRSSRLVFWWLRVDDVDGVGEGEVEPKR